MDTSAEKILSILDLFGAGHGFMEVEDIANSLDLTRSTCYRYVKSLVDRGYLVSSIGGGYTLGPQIMNLEYHLQNTDPLIRLGRPVIEELAADFPGTALICRVYRESFVAVASTQSEQDPRVRQWRGRGLPLVKGASARVIQAHLPRHRVVKLYDENKEQFEELGYSSFHALQHKLKEVKHRGSCHAFGEVHQGVNAVSAPLLGTQSLILGALTFTALADSLNAETMDGMEEKVRLLARVINRQLDEDRTKVS